MKSTRVVAILSGTYKDICCPVSAFTETEVLIALCKVYCLPYESIDVELNAGKFVIKKKGEVVEECDFKFDSVIE